MSSAERHGSFPAAAGAWVAACVVLVAVRYRASWPAYVALHERLAGVGVPSWLRNLDAALLMLVATIALATLAWARTRTRAGGTPLRALLAGPPSKGWARVTALAAAPMVLGGIALLGLHGWVFDPPLAWNRVIGGVVRTPIVEEFFFRGLMVAVAATLLTGGPAWRLSGPAFWGLALLSGLVFGSAHVAWSIAGLEAGWVNLIVTTVGGVWYAWLMQSWKSVFVPMMLHAAMNLGWLLAGAAGGAGGGGLVENLLRAGTIAIGTWLTIRANRADHMPPEPRGQ
jgi:membrane protease YdiL (CAAX protease family)